MVSHTKIVLEDSTTFHYAGSSQCREECHTDAIDTKEGSTEAVDEKTYQPSMLVTNPRLPIPLLYNQNYLETLVST